jgi:3-hydroxybutyryl-CoA dehydrogenase
MNYQNCPVAVLGESEAIPEVILCLLRAGHQVFGEVDPFSIKELVSGEWTPGMMDRLGVLYQGLPEDGVITLTKLVIIMRRQDLDLKKNMLRKVEEQIPSDTLMVINTESYSLGELHAGTKYPERIMGLNWVRPAHLTLFAELITLPQNNLAMVNGLMEVMHKHWEKDPYLLKKGRSIRSRLTAALVREAFYLVENGYVKEEDIDRACRNDAGYYLPFAGNCRYMDLMGTYLYGMVMKDLNPELSKMKEPPASFLKLLKEQGARGMTYGKGIYKYVPESIRERENLFLEFSKEMKKMMMRYPFPGKETVQTQQHVNKY